MNRVKRAILNAIQRFQHPENKEGRQLAWIILALILIAAIAANDLPQGRAAQAQVTPTKTVVSTAYPPPAGPAGQAVYPPPAPTPTIDIPNENETDGMIIGGVILVLIIIGGTLQVLRPRSQE